MNWGMDTRVKDLLLVTGSGRNVGKTTFICDVLASNPRRRMAAVKISPHFHEPTEGLETIIETETFRIYEETNFELSKDTSRYLQAGAVKSYYIQTSDDGLLEAFRLTSVLLDPDLPFIVESARLGKLLTPELFIFIQHSDSVDKPFSIDMREKADFTVFSQDNEFSMSPEHVYYSHNWRIEEHDYA